MNAEDGDRGCTREVHHRGRCRVRPHPLGDYSRVSQQPPGTHTPAGGPKPVGVLDVIARKASNMTLRAIAVSMAKAAGLQVLDPPRS